MLPPFAKQAVAKSLAARKNGNVVPVAGHVQVGLLMLPVAENVSTLTTHSEGAGGGKVSD